MEIELHVRVDGRYHPPIGAAIRVPDMLVQAFEPLKTTDCFIGRLAGDVNEGSAEHMNVLKIRKDAAEDLSEQLTRFILAEMQRYDTSNGYQKENKK